MRGVAILPVLYQHLFPSLPFATWGWLGVDLFFVISGFLITEILLHTREDRYYYSSFIGRRALRILPAYYLCLLVFPVIIAYIPSLLSKYEYFRTYELIFWIQGQNWLFFATGEESNRFFFSHFWSLAIEEQYYLIWPLVILFIRNERVLIRVIFLLLLLYIFSRTLAWIYWGNSDKTHSFQFLTHGDGLCFGSLIAIWKRMQTNISTKLITIAIVLILLELILFLLNRTGLMYIPHFPLIGYTLIGAVFALAVFYAVRKGSIYTRILNFPPLRFLGKISFGIYIYHFPLLFICEAWLLPLISEHVSGPAVSVIFPFAVLFISITMSVISYYFFEKFFLRQKRFFMSSATPDAVEH